ncbi:MAG TPA: glycosyltransferase family 2 protein [Thermoanaerobaculia bacterium]|nr:glycosyltransferase family 2 protein [Thermoanaerobaculia bacterium]
MTSKHRTAGALLVVMYTALVLPLIVWPWNSSVSSLVAFTLYSLVALGFATEVVELILALAWAPCRVPVVQAPPPRQKVAVLMTVCDDWSERRLSDLAPLAAIGYQVFLLDDSSGPSIPSNLIPQGVTQICRTSRKGAKAGNLNHWLERFGPSFEYTLLLDADSLVSVEAADTLLQAAEHPDNLSTAVFQAKIEPVPRPGSLFATSLAVIARPRARILERLHGPLGIALSSGHNQLLRLAPIHHLGGFDETLTAEDTALSLELAALGWNITLVDVWTQDEDPETITAYNRRTLRWARQTIEIFRRDWQEVPVRLKLLLCRHLLLFGLPIAGTLLLFLSLWNGPRHPEVALGFFGRSLQMEPGYAPYGLSLWALLLVSLLFVVLRLALARREGVRWRDLLVSTVFGNAPLALLILPLAGAMLTSALGASVRFVPTNSRAARATDALLVRRLRQGIALALLLAALILCGLRRPGSLLIGANLIWYALLLGSPLTLLVLYWADRRRTSAKTL